MGASKPVSPVVTQQQNNILFYPTNIMSCSVLRCVFVLRTTVFFTMAHEYSRLSSLPEISKILLPLADSPTELMLKSQQEKQSQRGCPSAIGVSNLPTLRVPTSVSVASIRPSSCLSFSLKHTRNRSEFQRLLPLVINK